MSLSDLNIRIKGHASHFEKELKKVERSLNRSAYQFRNLGSTLSTHLTLPIVGIGVAATRSAANFERAMSEVKAVSSDISTEGFDRLKEAALDLGKSTTKTATEAAQGLKFLAQAGYSTSQQLAAIRPVLRLSEAGAIDLGIASDLATDAMAALSISADKLNPYLDVVAKTSTLATTNIQQLLEATIAVGGQFKSLRTPIAEQNALLAIMANRGIKGAEAGNGLSTVLINLTTGAGRAGTAMKELGLSAFDNEGNFRGIATILTDLNAKLAGMTEEQQNLYKAMIGGKQRVTELNALLDGMANEYTDIYRAASKADGALEQIAGTMQDNFAGTMTRLKSALEGIAISIGNILIPIWEKLAAKVQDLTVKFDALSPATKETIVRIGLYVATIGPALIVTAKMIGAISTLATAFRLATVMSAGLARSLATLLFTNPYTAAIAAIGGAAFYAYKKFEKFRATVDGLLRSMKEFSTHGKVFQFVMGYNDSLYTDSEYTFDIPAPDTSALEDSAEVVKRTIKTIGDSFENMGGVASDVLKDKIPSLLEQVTDKINALRDSVNNSILSGDLPGAQTAINILTRLEEQMDNVYTTAQRLKDGPVAILAPLPGRGGTSQLKTSASRVQEIGKRTQEINLQLKSNPQDAQTVKNLRAELRALHEEAAILAPALPESFKTGVDGSIEQLDRLAEAMSSVIEEALGSMIVGVAEGLGDMIAGIGNGTNMLQAAFTPLINMMEQLGKMAIQSGVAIEGIKKALSSLSGPIAIGAGIALIALSRVVKARISSLGKGMFRGGYVDGEGTQYSDSIPTRLSKGEYVLRAAAVRSIGVNTLDKINAAPAALNDALMSMLDMPTRRLGGMMSAVMADPASPIPTSIFAQEAQAVTHHHTGTFRISGSDLILAMERAAPIHYARTGRKL
jgi:TP901 family phage tail tape measure protein